MIKTHNLKQSVTFYCLISKNEAAKNQSLYLQNDIEQCNRRSIDRSSIFFFFLCELIYLLLTCWGRCQESAWSMTDLFDRPALRMLTLDDAVTAGPSGRIFRESFFSSYRRRFRKIQVIYFFFSFAFFFEFT